MSNFNFDYKQFKDFVADFGIMEDEFQTFLKGYLLQQAQRVVRSAKLRTPVDTGALRNSWGIGSQKIALKSTIDDLGDEHVTIDTKNSQIANIDVIGNYLQVTIWNGMEYASYIEFGHHSYPPQHMLTIAIDTVEKAMPGRFNKQFKEFLKSKGVG